MTRRARELEERVARLEMALAQQSNKVNVLTDEVRQLRQEVRPLQVDVGDPPSQLLIREGNGMWKPTDEDNARRALLAGKEVRRFPVRQLQLMGGAR